MSGLVERLREPDWHNPNCPFDKHCYCGDDENPSPHDKVRHPDGLEAADFIDTQAARILELEGALGHISQFSDDFASRHGKYLRNHARAALDGEG